MMQMQSEQYAFTKTQEKIANAAFTLIAENGYKATTTKEIAKKAGVNESTLFKNFGNKLELFKTVYNYSKDTLEVKLSQIETATYQTVESFILSSSHLIADSFFDQHALITITTREIGNVELSLDKNSILENTINMLTSKLECITGIAKEHYVTPMFMHVTSLMYAIINKANDYRLTDDLAAEITVDDIVLATTKLLVEI